MFITRLWIRIKYIFSKPRYEDWFIEPKSRLKVIWCRLRNHPYQVVYYSSGGFDDPSCSNCGDSFYKILDLL